MSIKRSRDKQNVVYLYKECYSVLKRKKREDMLIHATTRMNLEDIILNKIS